MLGINLWFVIAGFCNPWLVIAGISGRSCTYAGNHLWFVFAGFSDPYCMLGIILVFTGFSDPYCMLGIILVFAEFSDPYCMLGIILVFAGFSDPYCMLGIIPGSQLLKEKLQEKVSTSGENVSSDEENTGTLYFTCVRSFSPVFALTNNVTPYPYNRSSCHICCG